MRETLGLSGEMRIPCHSGTVVMKKLGTLLVADCGKDLSRALRTCLQDAGCRVIAVDCIRDLLLTLQCEKINVLIMDTCLSEDIGSEAISIIKGLYRNIPIIVTTDENNPKRESHIRQKGIFYYHVKSFGMDELMLAVTNAMARSLR